MFHSLSKRVFSGIRATGRLHLGNYLGAVKGMLALQDSKEYETLFSVVDLHTMTTPFNKKTLAATTNEVVLDYLASGLDPTKSMILLQSDVADLHTQLMFYFSTVVSIARMQHLPTYKDKIKQHPKHNSMALLNYPVLMAADILIYKASKVPVGIDQESHLEIAREVARKMNTMYDLDFPEPTRFATKGEYVPSLTGEGKMSKSVEGSSINLTDDIDEIKHKLASAPTDSGQGDKVPAEGGVANLLTFVELFQGEAKKKEYEKQYTGTGIRYGALKTELAEAIYENLKPIQEKRKEFENDPKRVKDILDEGSQKARIIASKTIEEVKSAMGLSN